MHAKPDLRVVLKWMINRSGSVITDVIPHGCTFMNSNFTLIAMCIAFVSGCTLARPITKKIDTRTDMQTMLHGQLSLLADREAVTDFLRTEGFECKFVENGAFDDRIGSVNNEHDTEKYHGGVIGDTREPRTFKNKDFVLGHRKNRSTWPSDQIWSVAIVMSPDGAPQDVYVFTRNVK